MPFLDGLRAFAIAAMVANHTGRWWIDGSFGWPRYHLIYITTTVAAPIFLFLVGFCQAIAHHNATVLRGQNWAGTAPRYLRRGVQVILAGYLLNLIVFPHDPLWQLGVLQSIGFSIVALVPALSIIGSARGRALILAVSVALYVAFALSHVRLEAWLGAHPLVAQVAFADFPPWPWTALVLASAVLGWRFCEANRQGDLARARYFRAMAVAGAACLVAFVAYDAWMQTPVRFGFMRDFIVNRHWTPRGVTLFWVGAVLFISTPAAWYLMDRRGWAPRWLVELGQTAMMLYFVHQIIVFTIAKQWLGVAFHSWLGYAAANVALMVALLYIGKGWLGIRPRLRRRPAPGAEPAPATAGGR
jgi:peptidoglycan/LPS O-acetylase OafA/YrhL